MRNERRSISSSEDPQRIHPSFLRPRSSSNHRMQLMNPGTASSASAAGFLSPRMGAMAPKKGGRTVQLSPSLHSDDDEDLDHDDDDVVVTLDEDYSEELKSTPTSSRRSKTLRSLPKRSQDKGPQRLRSFAEEEEQEEDDAGNEAESMGHHSFSVECSSQNALRAKARHTQPKRSSWCAPSPDTPSRIPRSLQVSRSKILPPALQSKRDRLRNGSFLSPTPTNASKTGYGGPLPPLKPPLSVGSSAKPSAAARFGGQPPRRRSSSYANDAHRRGSLPMELLRSSASAAAEELLQSSSIQNMMNESSSVRDMVLDNQESFSEMLDSYREKPCDSSESSLEVDLDDLLDDFDDSEDEDEGPGAPPRAEDYDSEDGLDLPLPPIIPIVEPSPAILGRKIPARKTGLGAPRWGSAPL